MAVALRMTALGLALALLAGCGSDGDGARDAGKSGSSQDVAAAGTADSTGADTGGAVPDASPDAAPDAGQDAELKDASAADGALAADVTATTDAAGSDVADAAGADTADAAGAADAVDTVGPDAGDAGGCEVYAIDKTMCFGPNPPGPGDKVKALAAPDMGKCQLPVSGIVDGFFAGKEPKTTIGIELGIVDSQDVFQKYQDSGWVMLVPGLQPGFHVWVAVRLTVPGLKADATALQRKTVTEITGWDGCDFTALNFSKTIYPKHKAGALQEGSASLPGVQLRFKKANFKDMPKSELWQVCGRWLTIRADFYNPATKTFGRKWLQVRTHAQSKPDYGKCK